MQLKTALFMICAAVFCAQFVSAGPSQHPQNNIKTVNHAFSPGEKLTYSISWSTILEAGISVMEVKDDRTTDGRHAYRFISCSNSVGLVDLVYPVRDIVESMVDAGELYSLSFRLNESHGTRKRQRKMTFDHENKSVRIVINNDKPETYPAPERMQDALSSLYYVRTRQDFIVGKPIVVDVADSGKNWSVEVHTLGRERVKTPAGEFDTIKVKTYPKYEGVFMHKGEIFIWLTDDARKIPVLMQSKISIGSIVATLTDIQRGNDKL